MRNKDAGQIRMIEAFLAILIIFSSYTLSSNLSLQNNVAHDDLSTVGLQALTKLDSDGSLGNCITDKNWSGLRQILSLALPTGISFNATVYDESMQQINADAVSNGAFGSQNIDFVECVCATQRPVFHNYIIHLHLAVAA